MGDGRGIEAASEGKRTQGGRSKEEVRMKQGGGGGRRKERETHDDVCACGYCRRRLIESDLFGVRYIAPPPHCTTPRAASFLDI